MVTAARCPAGVQGLLARIDSLQVVNIIAWPYPDTPGLLAERLGVRPAHRIYTAVGADTPQRIINSTAERIDTVADKSRGFIYLVSLTGVTGARDALPVELEGFIKRVRQRAKQPLCVGFGVATPQHAQRIGAAADGVIVGSRNIDLIDEDPTLASLQAFISSLRMALDSNGDI